MTLLQSCAARRTADGFAGPTLLACIRAAASANIRALIASAMVAVCAPQATTRRIVCAYTLILQSTIKIIAYRGGQTNEGKFCEATRCSRTSVSRVRWDPAAGAGLRPQPAAAATLLPAGDPGLPPAPRLKPTASPCAQSDTNLGANTAMR